MQFIEGRAVLSASDLVAFTKCEHLAVQRAEQAAGRRAPAVSDDPFVEVLSRYGDRHEDRVWERLGARGGVSFKDDKSAGGGVSLAGLDQVHQRTVAAMREGVPAIREAFLFDGRWLGWIDVAERVERPSEFGDWSYEVVDAKLAGTLRPSAVVQTTLYSQMLADVQGTVPERLHLELGDGTRESLPVAKTSWYVSHLRGRFDRWLASRPTGGDTYPEPVGYCPQCVYQAECAARRRDDDHLSLVAFARTDQRRKLVAAGIDTVVALARLDDGARVPRLNPTTLDGLRRQAAAQVASRDAGSGVPHVLVKDPLVGEDSQVVPEHGLFRLPDPDPADVFFDIEGNPFVDGGGLEYLLGAWLDATGDVAALPDGTVDRDGRFVALWADDLDQERDLFVAFMDWLEGRFAANPGAHVYHYAPYEQTALHRLSSKHGVKTDEVDAILRAGRLVDLYAVVRQGLVVGAESYSIKRLEPLFMPEARSGEVEDAAASVVAHEAYLASSDAGERTRLRDGIVAYNRRDCEATQYLRDWLEGLRDELVTDHGLDGNALRPIAGEGAAHDRLAETVDAETVLRDRVLARAEQADESERAAWRLLADLVGYHRREQRAAYAEWLRTAAASVQPETALDDSDVLAAVTRVGTAGWDPDVRVYAAPKQELRMRAGEQVYVRATGDDTFPERFGTLVSVVDDPDDDMLVAEVKPKDPAAADPDALLCSSPLPNDAIRKALWESIEDALDHGLSGSFGALLLRRVPAALADTTDEPDGAARVADAVRRLGDGVLAVQGPPGTGKTTVAARTVCDLAALGWRVGVTALSHAAVRELTERAFATADEGAGLYLLRAQAGTNDHIEQRGSVRYELVNGNNKVFAQKRAGADVVAGSPFLFCNRKLDPVNVLVVDEAGQVPLANALAMAVRAREVVLVGDPAQLRQPNQAAHPNGSDVSAMEHMLGGRIVADPCDGVLLDVSYRMHPALCEIVSHLAYDGRLDAADGNDAQCLVGAEGTMVRGVVPVEVAHAGNRSESDEEADAIVPLVARLREGGWVDRHGDPGMPLPVGDDDVLVVAPYNAQVNLLRRRLAAAGMRGVRVGTVDRFQGQQAAAVVVSTTTSSADTAPRGLRFVADTSRLNVALSRAKAAAFLVHSPTLLDSSPSTVADLMRLNDLCRIVAH